MADAKKTDSKPAAVRMVPVRYLTCMSGVHHVREVGDRAELPEAEAAALLAAGYVERVETGKR